MELRNVTIKGDNATFGDSIFSKDFNVDQQGMTWLNPDSIKLVGGKYTSFNLSWEPIDGAESYVLLIVDYTSNKTIGYPFLHWAVANISGTTLESGANLDNINIVQGVNSSVTKKSANNENGILFEILPSGYRSANFDDAIGFYPIIKREQPHTFLITIVGIKEKSIDIKPGFYVNDILAKVQKSVVAVHYKSFWFKGI